MADNAYNIRVVANKTSAKAGETVKFTVSWNGTQEYYDSRYDYTFTCTKVSITGKGDWHGIAGATLKDITNDKRESFDVVMKEDWHGTKSGAFEVVYLYDYDGPKVGKVTSTNSISVDVLGVMKPIITISPTNPTIRPGETQSFSASISGVDAPYDKVEYSWKYKNLTGTDPNFQVSYTENGQNQVTCDVFIKKSGYEDGSAQGKTTVTEALKEMTGVSLDVVGPGKLFVGDELTITSVLSGQPEGTTVEYHWTFSGKTYNTPTIPVNPDKAGTETATLTVNLYAPNYEGATLTKTVDVVAEKVESNDPHKKITPRLIPTANSNFDWGPDNKTFEFDLVADLKINETTLHALKADPASVPKMTIAGEENNPYYELIYTASRGCFTLRARGPLPPSELEKRKIVMNVSFLGDDTYEGGVLEFFDNNFSASRATFRDSNFIVNGQSLFNTPTYYVKKVPGSDLKFSVTNYFDTAISIDKEITPGYRDEMIALGKRGKYELINFEGKVEATADAEGNFSYVLPDEEKTLSGKIRHTLADDALWSNSPYVAEHDISIELVENPMVPMPSIVIVQDPNPAEIDDEIKFTRTFNDLPEGASTADTEWIVNGASYGTTETITVTGTRDTLTVRNITKLAPEGFSPATITSPLFTAVVDKKPWPEMKLVIAAPKETIAWGEEMNVSFTLSNSNEIVRPDELVIEAPDWYKDGALVEDNNPDGSLHLVGTVPGNHTIEAIVRLTHPDYDDGYVVIQSNIVHVTTEKRIVETKTVLLPAEATIGLSHHQLFTAEVTGVPPDGRVSYEWHLGEDKVGNNVNSYNFNGTEEGVFSVKVVTTTKAQGADDFVSEATAKITVKRNIMAATINAIADKTTINAGESVVLSCTVSDAPEGAAIAYKWSNDATESSQTVKIDKPGKISYTCTATITHPDFEPETITSAPVEITVNALKQSTKASAKLTSPAFVHIGDDIKCEATVTDAPAGSNTVYEWSTGETGSTSTSKAVKGENKVTVKITVTHESYDPFTFTSPEMKVTATDDTVQGTLTITGPDEVKVGEKFTLKSDLNAPESTVKYKWSTGETTKDITVTAKVEGETEYTCEVTMESPNLWPGTASATKKVTAIKVAPPVIDSDIYVHPLPWRSSAYIWCGWWVMDAIEEMTEAGKDWKTATAEDTKYFKHLNVLAQMLVDYPEVDVQESRNGYIIHRTALEAGIIY